jgi:MerR family transcriptional regulator, copper efflux regulator
LNIGQASQASGVTAKMIRHYEAIGLIPAAVRSRNGYRDYSTHDVHRLKFVRRARDLGFPMPQIRDLLALWSDRSKGNSEVRSVASAHIKALEQQETRLREMIGTLQHLVRSCRSENRAECPIMAEFGADRGRIPSRSSRTPRDGA